MGSNKTRKPKDEEQLIRLIHAKKGNIQEIANAFSPRVSRQTVYNWIEKSKKLSAELTQAQESLLDFAESQMALLIQGVPKFLRDKKGDFILHNKEKVFDGFIIPPNPNLIQFFLKTKGKSRGYVEKNELEVKHQVYEVDFSEPE
jgi:predicted DNA-binding protein YlxM (UPF0122 family)